MCDLELETKVAEGLRIFHKHLNSVLNVKAQVGAFNQEKALVGTFSVITSLDEPSLQALVCAWSRYEEVWTPGLVTTGAWSPHSSLSGL